LSLTATRRKPVLVFLVAPCYLGFVAPQSRAEAIAKIRALAEAGCVSMQRRAQGRMEALGYNIKDVEDCLCDLREDECTKDSAPEHPEFGEGAWVYEFVTDFFGE